MFGLNSSLVLQLKDLPTKGREVTETGFSGVGETLTSHWICSLNTSVQCVLCLVLFAVNFFTFKTKSKCINDLYI
jgi:hypothetical protein